MPNAWWAGKSVNDLEASLNGKQIQHFSVTTFMEALQFHTLFPCQKYILSPLLYADYLIPDCLPAARIEVLSALKEDTETGVGGGVSNQCMQLVSYPGSWQWGAHREPGYEANA